MLDIRRISRCIACAYPRLRAKRRQFLELACRAGLRPMMAVRSLQVVSDPNGRAGRNGGHAHVRRKLIWRESIEREPIERKSLANLVAATAQSGSGRSRNRVCSGPPRNAYAG